MKNTRLAVFVIVAFLTPTSFLTVSAHAQKPNFCNALNTNDLAGCTNEEISVWLQSSRTKLNEALSLFDEVVNSNIETRCMRLRSKSTLNVDDLKDNFQNGWDGLSVPAVYVTKNCFPDELSNPCRGAYSCDYFQNFLNSDFIARFGDAYAPAYQTLLENLNNGCENEVCKWNYGQFESTIVKLWFSRNKALLPLLQKNWTPVYVSYKEFSDASYAASVAIAANDLKVKQNAIARSGNCMFNSSDTTSQIAINGKTYVWPNGDKKLCSKGRWISKGKIPLTALYLTCAIFNSQSDRGCYVKDSHGGLTWLFNLPAKQIIGKPVSRGSYYTSNGYCKVTLYKNFAYRDSCG